MPTGNHEPDYFCKLWLGQTTGPQSESAHLGIPFTFAGLAGWVARSFDRSTILSAQNTKVRIHPEDLADRRDARDFARLFLLSTTDRQRITLSPRFRAGTRVSFFIRLPQPGSTDMGIDLGSNQALMPEQFLNAANVGAAV